MESKFIKFVGLELEGGWKKNIYREERGEEYDGRMCNEDSEWHPDNSVQSGMDVRGEIVSRPLPLGKMEAWVKKYYPQDVNRSCGLHIHVSFKDNTFYQALMDKPFTKYYLEEIKKWGENYPIKNDEFWRRLAGENNYCLKKWNADCQAKFREKISERYTMLNFCWNLHGTMEIRVLPMFKDVNVAIAAINKSLDIVQTYLLLTEKKLARESKIQLMFMPEELEPELITVNERM
jgi:hypothetical protein